MAKPLYEIHITLDAEQKLMGWKSSRILDDSGTFFLTSYAPSESLARAKIAIALDHLGMDHVRRVKIEHIVYDERYE